MAQPSKTSKQLKEVKVLRPWVKYGMGAVTVTLGYLVFTSYIWRPKPYVIEFDLEKIKESKKLQ